MIKKIISLITLLATYSVPSYAMPPFVGADYSGEYLCKGENDQVGTYQVIVNLKLNTKTSHDIYGVYDFNTESNHQAAYTGQIMTKDRQFAMTFKLLTSKSADFNTGMGEFRKIGYDRWRFRTTYYEPDGTGGNFGTDYCTMKRPAPLSSNASKNGRRQKNLAPNTA